jgi:hypothetical protein
MMSEDKQQNLLSAKLMRNAAAIVSFAWTVCYQLDPTVLQYSIRESQLNLYRGRQRKADSEGINGLHQNNYRWYKHGSFAISLARLVWMSPGMLPARSCFSENTHLFAVWYVIALLLKFIYSALIFEINAFNLESIPRRRLSSALGASTSLSSVIRTFLSFAHAHTHIPA